MGSVGGRSSFGVRADLLHDLVVKSTRATQPGYLCLRSGAAQIKTGLSRHHV